MYQYRRQPAYYRAKKVVNSKNFKVAAGIGSYYANKYWPRSSIKKAMVNNAIRSYRPGYTKKTYYRRKTKPSINKLKSQVRQVQKSVESNMGTHVQRRRATGGVLASTAQKIITSSELCSITLLEEVLAQLRYYDPSAPSALVQASGVTGTYQKEFYFKSIYHCLSVRNNYQVPCKVKLFFVQSKRDTSIAANTAFTNGLADVGNPTSTSPLVYLSDSPQFNDLYSIVTSSKSVMLQPGAELSISNISKGFQYDPSFVDSHALSYQRRYQDMQFVIDFQGAIGHDTVVAGQQTNLPCGLDWWVHTTFTVRYSAGADIKYIYIDDEADSTFTNGGVVSNMPVSDNQSYSVA